MNRGAGRGRNLSPQNHQRVRPSCLENPKPVLQKILDFQQRISGAEAPTDSTGFIPGINPRPTALPSFSAACKARPFLSSICGTTKVVPFQNPTFTTGC